MSLKIFTFSVIALLLNIGVFTTATNRAAEMAESTMISAAGRGAGNFFNTIIAGMAASNVASTDSIINDIDLCESQSEGVLIGEEAQMAAIAEQAAVLVSAAADRYATRIEVIIQQLSARLMGTAGSAVAVASSQIKLATGEINAITDRAVSEAQLIARSALATAERAISSAAELSVAVSQSETGAIQIITDAAAQRAKRLAEGLAGCMTVATVS
ncbi:uncharacterized protein LOC123298990 [Chrysoperla carnea]|uniref:uncharacterized protein LOC123298990 n=1 Tax=Chrysoperla carnea TaxID=189513 RepID=UPI001D07D0C4|nr:uncharacterized protein LOC123298990 [Chrysoperla carnea]